MPMVFGAYVTAEAAHKLEVEIGILTTKVHYLEIRNVHLERKVQDLKAEIEDNAGLMGDT